MSSSAPHVLTIGNAIVDILAHVENDFLDRHHLHKSSMNLCTQEVQAQLLDDITVSTTMAGGSAANTAASLASMGLPTGFVGTVGHDHWGKTFSHSLEHSGVNTYLETIETDVTGTSVIVITPDSERTMNTHLGAAGKISQSTFDHGLLKDVPLVYVEGYAYDSSEAKQAVQSVVATSRRYGQKVMLSLSDVGCVTRHHQDFTTLVRSIDIVIGNEHEFLELFRVDNHNIDDTIIRQNAHLCAPTTVITRSEKGCILVEGDSLTHFDAHTPTELVDVTGAGDQFAAGFIYGISQGYSLRDAIHCGTILATHVISQTGPRLATAELINFARQFRA